ncbi:MAG TPA: DEAD/DEAH box helicase [Candidatus Tetragenococcus pullicola]|nr:DEAD/DEAH box helicase [Candidatus Tetragenococcus pullicola]
MNALDLLQRPIRKYIYDQGWQELSKIQSAAIQYILTTKDNYILAAPTASGKTEAAFFPSIDAVKNFHEGVKIVYISPLVALINDQFKRVTDLCQQMDIPVTRWHAEASVTQKKRLLKAPAGILLITPESLEAMLMNHSEYAKVLFSDLEWVLIDEIHAFLSSNRGIQLKSLLERLQTYEKTQPRYIGMSATLSRSAIDEAKTFFPQGSPTKVLVDRGSNELRVTTNYFPGNNQRQSEAALQTIFAYSQAESMLVFPNSRADVEYLVVSLVKLGQQRDSSVHYFAHHASLTKEFRMMVESFAKNSQFELFTICCTSTLELGIDIGSVDSVVQYNAPFSVTSLSQRLGRSGRRTGISQLHFIATDAWDYVQGVAVIHLLEEDQLEKIKEVKKPYDVCAHQLLSLLMEHSGMVISEVKNLNHQLSIFSSLSDDEYKQLVQHLVDQQYIEKLENELIIGLRTEKEWLHGPDFYTQFSTEPEFSVWTETKQIGRVPFTPAIQEGANLFLAGQVWKIQLIKLEGNKLIVEPAIDGQPPVFTSSAGEISHEVRQGMKTWLFAEKPRTGPEKQVTTELLSVQLDENPYFVTHYGKVGLRTFSGTKINRTLQLLFDLVTDEGTFYLIDKQSLLFSPNTAIEIRQVVRAVVKNNWNEADLIGYLERNSQKRQAFLNDMKYQALVPEELQVKYIVENKLDLDGAVETLETIGDN